MHRFLIILVGLLYLSIIIYPQSAPAPDENIPFLVTFGADSETSWGDDDFCQIFFFMIPSSHTNPVYIRVYDPDTGGDHDEANGDFNTTVSFSLYGGLGCWSDKDAQAHSPTGNYRSGILFSSKTFGNDLQYNKCYYTFGPLNPSEGEYVEKFDAHVFKIVAKGESGDDGNLYRYFLSALPNENLAIEGGNVFTYKYSFRLPDDQNQVSQIYPYVDDKTISIEVSNFDWDNDGIIKIISIAKNGVLCDVSGDDFWLSNKFPVLIEERNTTIEIQFVKNQKIKIHNNNVVVVVRNQYSLSLPFFVIPLGGAPVYTPKIMMKGL
ncbi:MAG: hypothetical protein R6W78_16310 [Bacteroidales bacterium]